MTLYYSLVFMLLTFEMALACLFISPLPFTWRRKVFRFLSTSRVVAKIQYGLKITFIFVGVLFVDAVQRMMRVASEGEAIKSGKGVQDVRTESNYAARKFYSQRNMYLTGFTLFMSLILSRTYVLILDLIQTQEQLALLQKNNAQGGRVTEEDYKAEVASLKAELEAHKRESRDFEMLKKQAAQQAQEYDRIASELQKANTSSKDD